MTQRIDRRHPDAARLHLRGDRVQLEKSSALFDPYVTEWLEDPHAVYRQLRESYPLYHNEEWDFWVLSRFEDVQRAARDWETFANTPTAEIDDSGTVAGPGYFLDEDPPDHTRLRNVLRRRFTPRQISTVLEGHVRDEIARLMAGFMERGEVDLADEFAWPLPVAVIATMLGLPPDEVPMLRAWIQGLGRKEYGDPAAPEDARLAAAELGDYFTDLVNRRIDVPGEDLVSDMASAMGRGELAREEIAGMCVLLCLAGTETTESSITNALEVLSKHPDQRRTLIADPAKIPAAIEEVLRYEPVLRFTGRRATKATELCGQRVPAGGRVVLTWAAANRDERRFPGAERFDIDRPSMRNIGFGEGIHHCLGAPLARLETRLALEALLPALGDYELAAPPIRNPVHNTRGLAQLRLTFEPQAIVPGSHVRA
jgi:cytochrome P450